MSGIAVLQGGSAPAEFGPWNPGIESQIPRALLPLSTIFRPENVFSSAASALELRGLTGFPLTDLVAFRPERLALHELLVRITADLAVPDGSRIGDLGINFREMARRLLGHCVLPAMQSLVDAYNQARGDVAAAVHAAFAAAVPARVVRSWGPPEIARVDALALGAASPLEALVCRTLARVMSALFATHGQAWGTRDLIVTLALDMVANTHGSTAVGCVLEPLLRAAAETEGYRRLPRQERPVVINTKGASASGKSTLRPLQKILAGEIGLQWEDFALISPDIWRKQLLDYESLGDAYKYAGAFTGEEVQIVDQKLDRYMELKNSRGEMSHLLIDRFRFDSFAADSDQAGSNLLTRFGQAAYLFFVITPPDQLVERAWKRGLEFGRYKAVDDTLAHAVEAYDGFPDLFFTWVGRNDMRLRFEFLDNTVPFGERPRTVAFGSNACLNVLDVPSLIDVERFAQIDINARTPAALFSEQQPSDSESSFLRRCVRAFQEVNFAEQDTARVYLRLTAGVAVWKDAAILERAMANAKTRAGLLTVAPLALQRQASEAQGPRTLPRPGVDGHTPTLGQWAAQRA